MAKHRALEAQQLAGDYGFFRVLVGVPSGAETRSDIALTLSVAITITKERVILVKITVNGIPLSTVSRTKQVWYSEHGR